MTAPYTPDDDARLNDQLDEFLGAIQPEDTIGHIVRVLAATNAHYSDPAQALRAMYWTSATAFRRLADERHRIIIRERFLSGGR